MAPKRRAEARPRQTEAEPRFNVMAMFDSLPAHIQAEVRPLAEQYHQQGQTMWRALEMALVETMEQFPEYVEQRLAQEAQQNPMLLARAMREAGLPQGVDADQLVQDMATRSSPVVQPFTSQGHRLGE